MAGSIGDVAREMVERDLYAWRTDGGLARVFARTRDEGADCEWAERDARDLALRLAGWDDEAWDAEAWVEVRDAYLAGLASIAHRAARPWRTEYLRGRSCAETDHESPAAAIRAIGHVCGLDRGAVVVMVLGPEGDEAYCYADDEAAARDADGSSARLVLRRVPLADLVSEWAAEEL